MRAVLIDPVAKTVEEIDSPLDLKSLYALLQCSTLDLVTVGEHDLYVDDEGLLVEDPVFFSIRGYPQPLAGRAVLCRHNVEGNCAPATLSLATVRQRVTFPRDDRAPR